MLFQSLSHVEKRVLVSGMLLCPSVFRDASHIQCRIILKDTGHRGVKRRAEKGSWNPGGAGQQEGTLAAASGTMGHFYSSGKE